jgi:urease accessory protein
LKAQTRAGKVIGARIDAIVVRSMTTHRERLAIAVATAFLLVVPTCSPAFAHTGSGSGGFVGGFLHPVFGPDHVVAMVAVGLWGAFLGPPAIWLLPIVFPLVMAGGGVLGILGVPLPGVEIGIAISAIVLGLMVALAARPPLWVAAVLVGAFAIFHGHAHGAELPPGTDAVAFSVGFVVATGLLHLTGIAFGLLARWPAGRLTVRAAGGAIALAGLAFLSGIG